MVFLLQIWQEETEERPQLRIGSSIKPLVEELQTSQETKIGAKKTELPKEEKDTLAEKKKACTTTYDRKSLEDREQSRGRYHQQ